jgi:ATP-dependent 26S proteasome regulatory subunit
MHQKIINYLKAGFSGLYLITHEEPRACSIIAAAAQAAGYRLLTWSDTEGLFGPHEEKELEIRDKDLDALGVLKAFGGYGEKHLLILNDYHPWLGGSEPSPMIVRTLKDQLADGRARQKTIIIVGCRLNLPPELEKEITVLDFALPDKAELELVVKNIATTNEQKIPKKAQHDALLAALGGLTTIEAENALALSVIESGKFDSEVVNREKAATIRKNGLLEIVENKVSLADVGGLDLLKAWLLKRCRAFSEEAEKYGLPVPKGMLATGPAGTGKSLTAKATAAVFGVPLLRLDAGRIFGSLVGESERNLRSIISLAEAVAPCVLWCDEVEKAFSGSASSGQTDSGTTARVFGNFLQWMNDKTKPVFVVMTANDITKLPPEFLRKGRLDEIFFVDLPNENERAEIWRIQIAKHGREPKKYDLAQLASNSEGFTGAEIEAVFCEALYQAFDEDTEPTLKHIAVAQAATVPLSKTRAPEIKALQDWATTHARKATAPLTVKPVGGRKLETMNN